MHIKQKSQTNRKDPIELYSTSLQFLWEQYNKLMGLGILASVGTIGFLLQGILFNKTIRDIIITSKVTLSPVYLMTAIIFAGISTGAFVVSRWCSQILMERQVYGDYKAAVKYFQVTLADETIWPTALKPKVYMSRFDRLTLLKYIGNLNEWAKWTGIVSIIISWLLSFIFILPLINTFSLTPISPASGSTVQKP